MPTYKQYSGEIAELISDYRAKGHKEAENFQPTSTAVQPDQNEGALRATAEKWLLDEQRLFDTAVIDANRGAVESRQKSDELRFQIGQLVSDNSLVSAVDAELSGERQALVDTTEKRVRSEVDYKAFRAANHISQLAEYPESRIWHFSIVVVGLVLETLLNTLFFENSQGLVGGAAVAFFVAAVNLSFSLLFGFGFRYKNLHSIDQKILGWFCLVLFAIFALYCNALFATFRAEYQLISDPDDVQQLRSAFVQALSQARGIFILETHIPDFMSFLLFGGGLVMALVAFWKGYTADDRYPGHGHKDRMMQAAKKIEAEKQDLVRQKIKELLYKQRAMVQSALHEPVLLSNRASSRMAELQNIRASFNTQKEAIQRDFSMVVGTYRDANKSVRGTPPPEYFKEVADLRPLVSDAGAEPVLTELQLVQKDIREIGIENQDRLNEKLQTLQTEATQILTNTFAKFIKGIEVEVSEKIERTAFTSHRQSA